MFSLSPTINTQFYSKRLKPCHPTSRGLPMSQEPLGILAKTVILVIALGKGNSLYLDQLGIKQE